MRNVLLAFASLAALTSIASAEPLSLEQQAENAEPKPTTYIQGGIMAGGNDGLFTAGARAEVGKQVASILWVHASFTMGTAGELFASGTGSILQGRVGADLMSCNASGVLCAYAGADVGMQHTQFDGMSDPWFCDSGDCQGDAIHDRATHAIGVGRVGLDVGGRHLRWRPGIEAAVAGDGVNGINLTQSLAYRF